MLVYLVMRCVEFEGSSVEGVYSSESDAKSAITAEVSSWSEDECCWYSDVSFYVDTKEVQ